MKKITKAIAAAGLAVGLTLAVTTPAEAVTLYRYCNWPYRAAVYAAFPGSGSVAAYSPGGALLGIRSGGYVGWHTPWEDVKFVSNGYSWISTECR